MKKLLLLLALFVFASTLHAKEKKEPKNISWVKSIQEVAALKCSSYEDQTYTNDFKKNELTIKKSVFKISPVFDGGKKVCSLTQNSQNLNIPEVSISENAEIDKILVSVYYSDGSGMIGSEFNDSATWFSKCSSDVMTDEVRCSVYQKDISLARDKDGYQIVIGHSNYPGTKAMFRSGKEKPITAMNESSFSESDTIRIIEQLSSGSPAVSRYTSWPDGKLVDNEINPKQFSAAKKFLDKIFENHY